MRLQIVEDSELIRKVTRLAFRGAHHLHEASNGRALAGAIEQAVRNASAREEHR